MIGVFMLGFGQPQSLDEVGDFIARVTGHEPSEKIARAARARYERIGGKSPLLEITRKQAAELEKLLEIWGITASVFIGMRHSSPLINEAIIEAKNAGVEKAVVITLAPQYADLSVGTYFRIFDEAYNKLGCSFMVKKIHSYGSHPLFIDAVAENLREAFNYSPPMDTATTPVIFSAHSLPLRSGLEPPPYLGELEAGARAVARRLGLSKTRIAFQSKGGGSLEWLSPSIEEVIEELAGHGETSVVVSPLGFVSDHVETLYDLDVGAREKAESMGLEFRRAPSLNDSPAFIKLLATLVRESIG